MASAKDLIETPCRIEPARVEETPEAIADLVAEVAAKSAVLGARLRPLTAANLASLVRLMNTYYSNLTEDRDTRPRDIEGALAGDVDENEGRGNRNCFSATASISHWLWRYPPSAIQAERAP
ncbi:hypothetical protein [Hyphomonas sp.]|uniref:hypothetical protein n=1 Tax=Hyphomonas sp. TaxID=87 RepID=UPI0032EFA78E